MVGLQAMVYDEKIIMCRVDGLNTRHYQSLN